MKCRTAIIAFLSLVAVALFLRGGDLALRPLHNDEAINAFKLERLWTQGEYRYDPVEYHGPVLYYLSLPVLAVVGWARPAQPDEVGMRMVVVLFGTGLVFLLLMLVDGMGWPSILGAALVTAVSPAFVYYSRYYIHEIPLVFFTFLVICGLWRYSRNPGFGWAVLVGGGAGLMYATKETFVFAIAAMALAGLAIAAWKGRSGVAGAVRSAGGYRVAGTHAAAAVLAGGVVALAFFTSFFRHPGGAWDAVRTYLIWFDRAGGASPHVHPWHFYLERVAWFHARGGPLWSEAGILVLALVGMLGSLMPRRADVPSLWLIRFLGLYTILLAGIYCAIPYKTPWCLLGALHGAVVLAGVGAATAWRFARPVWGKVILAGVLGLGVCHLGRQAWRASREYAADFRNPYVYGHTSADVFSLLSQLNEIAAADPAGHRLPVMVMAPESNYWPLPWYLRDFERVGWWDRVPEKADAPVMVVASKLNAGLEEKTGKAWLMVGLFELRPRYFVELYVEAGLWSRFLDRRAAEHRREAG